MYSTQSAATLQSLSFLSDYCVKCAAGELSVAVVVVLLAGVMGTGHVTYVAAAATWLIMIVLADEDANEGDLQFSIPRINARPGKGR